MDYPYSNQKGESLGTVELNDAVFGIEPNAPVVHQALVRQLANARQGTQSTKTRGEVAGSTRKLFKQKGTGRARQGGIRAPHRRGGGVTFGPKPRSYHKAMPKKMRRLALRSALSAKAADGELIVVDTLQLESPQTKAMIQVLNALQANNSTVLLVTAQSVANVILSARNLEGVYTLPASHINVERVLAHRYLVMTLDAVRKAEEIWGGQAAAEEAA